ncbi:hypothetical protein LIPSTDRAFT_73199 [Lipomyces starkeyi NRRL Y-11557]|uniref:Uncharacterized protein n=1 Tax=Lipomyces starkeyi NRRL Y-11557 TaxID=675824 RepID=A0A1E3Q2W6_LIPST|nr:hypothetical protein LIPSTDRAFT_73199 [Lipomyces starkeyi NRRL Y-11557]
MSLLPTICIICIHPTHQIYGDNAVPVNQMLYLGSDAYILSIDLLHMLNQGLVSRIVYHFTDFLIILITMSTQHVRNSYLSKLDNEMMWLAHKRKLITFGSVSYTELSPSCKFKVIEDIDDCSDLAENPKNTVFGLPHASGMLKVAAEGKLMAHTLVWLIPISSVD